LCLLDASKGGTGVPLSGSVGRKPFEIKTDFINDGSPYATAWMAAPPDRARDPPGQQWRTLGPCAFTKWAA